MKFIRALDTKQQKMAILAIIDMKALVFILSYSMEKNL
jgi:hypothetical protein